MNGHINQAWFADHAKRLHHGVIHDASSVGTARLLYGLVACCRPGVVVEVGAYRGDTTAWLGRAVIENGYGEVIAFETDPGLAAVARASVAEALGVSAPVKIETTNLLDQAGVLPCDFAFIDPNPKTLYTPIFEKLALSPGGIVCAHDLTHIDAPLVAIFLEHLRNAPAPGYEIIQIQQERGLVLARKVA